MKHFSLSSCALNICAAAIVTLPAFAMLSGCSGIQSQSSPPTMFPQSLAIAGGNKAAAVDLGIKSLAVTFGGGVLLFNNAGKSVAHLNLPGSPVGDTYDSLGNLYVAIPSPPEVLEFAPGAHRATFKYSKGLTEPENVATDMDNNVYVVDLGRPSGSVTKFPHRRNVVANQCGVHAASANYGVAVGRYGGVFVSWTDIPSGFGFFTEYQAGLKGCGGKFLSVTLGASGGIRFDRHWRLIACEYGLDVDIIDPPYTSVSAHLPMTAFNVALNEKNTLIFSTYPDGYGIGVYDYPSGQYYRSLGNSMGQTFGVAAR